MPKLRAAALPAVVIALVLGVLGVAAPARALDVPPPPTGLTPSGTTASGAPILSWNRGADVTSYDVQVSRSSGFGTLLAGETTTNHQLVPTTTLPEGTTWWRVRATGPGGAGDWATTSFTIDAYGAPSVTGPADAATFAQPDQVPTFSWLPVRAATGYTLRISTDQQFVDPNLITTYSTAQTSFVPTSLDIVNTYYWQVRADLGSGISTSWSSARSYRLLGLQIPSGWAPVSPAMDPTNPSVFPIVQDAVLDWPAIRGADRYDLQVSTDQNFNTLVVDVGSIVGSSYARPQTLNNDQYYWRVRPVDSAGRAVPWSAVPTWRFRRQWPHQPQLEYPADNATVGDPFFLQWTGIKHASRYVVQISTSSTFEPASTVRSCETRQTALVPANGNECWPAAVGTYYWRVIGYDDFANDPPRTDTTFGATPVRRFTYDPALVQLQTPANGGSVTVPTLTWSPLALAARYAVTITSTSSGNVVASKVTAATSFTPRGKLDPGTYRWQVQPVSTDGRYGAEILPQGQRTFTLAAAPTATASSPEPDTSQASTTGGTFTRFPELKWSPVAGAKSYDVRVRRTGTIGWTAIERTEYPATSDTGSTFLPPDSYEWYVTANLDGGSVVGANRGQFVVVSPETVVGYKAALLPTGFASGDFCGSALPSECQNLRQTPVLRWDAASDAGFYRVYVSADPELTNLVGTYDVATNMWLPTNTLADSQAGSAYYWLVVPCTFEVCAPPVHADHAFNKLSLPVVSASPGIVWTSGTDVSTAPVLTDDVPLVWNDLLGTEQDPATSLGDTSLTTRPRTEVRQYRVQTATDPQFTNTLDDLEVDQTSFTSFGTTYPDGPIYWRVRGLDGSNKPMPWSDVRVFTKRAPVPLVTSDPSDSDGILDSVVPQPDAVVSGGQRFQWNALPFASSYDLQVYKNGDLLALDGNRVRNENTRQIGFTPSTPLAAGGTYTWRVRRIDPRGRAGGWSPLVRFSVSSAQLTTLSPASGASVAPADSLFTWEPQAGAASYLWERRNPSNLNVVESRSTVATAWAPVRTITGGSWEWRITASDASGQVLGVSSWQPFTVSERPAATSPVIINGGGAVGTTLTLTPPTWDMPDVVTTYQWFRGSTAIDGATDTSYVVQGADAGQPITVRATGRRPGYGDGTSTSAAVIAGSGDVLVPNTPPSVSGNPQVGSTFTAHPGTWDHDPTYTYQWYRKGKPINGATSRTYDIVAADAGLSLAVVVTASSPGYGSASPYATSPKVDKLDSRTAIALSANPVAGRDRSTATVTVTVPGLSSPLGSVVVAVDGKKVRTVQLRDGGNGRVDVLLPRLKPGKHTVRATYAGSTATNGSAKSVRLKATK